MADIARSMRQRQTPLALSLASCGPASMQVLLCAFGGGQPDTDAPDRPLAMRPSEQPVRCLSELALQVKMAADMPEPEPSDAQASPLLSLVRRLTTQVPAFDRLDALSIQLLTPEPVPTGLSATERQALSGLSDALSNMQLMSLSFSGPQLDPPPDELQRCLRITRQRLMHRHWQFDAAVSCIGWGGPGRILPSELGSLILEHPAGIEASLRQAALVPALDRTSLLMLVDRYNHRVEASNASLGIDDPDRMPLHPLTGLARSIRSRQVAAPTETVTVK